MNRAARAAVLAMAVVLGAGCGRDAPRVAVGAAASLRNAMPELADRFRATAGIRVDVSYGSSNVLADKLEAGAALDAVVLAEDEALDTLIARGAVTADSRRVVATNAIVLVGPAGSPVTFAALASASPATKIAIGDPATVPAGRYAQAYLEQLGIWDAVHARLVLGGDVAAVLALAQAGTAAFAIVYRTDAIGAAPLVTLDQPSDAPVVHVVGGVVARSAQRERAARFVAFLASPDGQAILARHGFGPAPVAR